MVKWKKKETLIFCLNYVLESQLTKDPPDCQVEFLSLKLCTSLLSVVSAQFRKESCPDGAVGLLN